MAKKSHGADTNGHGPDTIVDAALALAAEKGWRGLALADVADRAGVKLAELVAHFPNRTAILEAYVDRIDQRMMAGDVDRDESPRDRLFDVIMRRFDAMAADRKALSAILRQSTDDPWALLCGGRRMLRTMALILETAGISASGLRGLAKVHGVAAIYLYVFKKFLEDESTDLARTMAALDKALRRASDCSGIVFRRSSAFSPSPTSDER